jgi:two-component sensor histidine kinase
MLSVPALDDTARGQTPKRSAHGLKRHSKVFTNIRPVHRQIYLGRAFASCRLKEAQRFKLTWTEKGGPAVLEPTRHSFGTRLINRLAERLQGDVR